jgi:hypothetical protein
MRSLAVVLLAACGGTSGSPPAPAAPSVSLVAPRANDRDVVVAQVNGRPVWGSCVAAQVRRGHVAREVAVRECIDFELLAQTAEKRGLAADHEVAETTRSAMVSQLIATQFEDRYQAPADFGDRFAKLIEQNAWRMHRPELRASTYVRITVPDKAPPGAEPTAHQTADAIANELANETGLFNVNLVETATRIAAGAGIKLCTDEQAKRPEAKLSPCVDTADHPASPADALETNYAAVLFSIPEVGRIAPPKRTKWGWDVVLWTGGLPAKESTRDDLVAEVFPELRRSYFVVWVNQMIKELGVKIELDPAQVAKLDREAP